jgi:predicted DNA-binding protein (MmcQ/YjbR family)
MNHAEIQTYGLNKLGTSLRTPFDPNLPVLFVGDKMFVLLGMTGDEQSVNLKTNPETAWLQRNQYPGHVLPGYHMNKQHWNTVILNSTVPKAELLQMIDESYMLVLGKLPKSDREGILALL